MTEPNPNSNDDTIKRLIRSLRKMESSNDAVETISLLKFAADFVEDDGRMIGDALGKILVDSKATLGAKECAIVALMSMNNLEGCRSTYDSLFTSVISPTIREIKRRDKKWWQIWK